MSARRALLRFVWLALAACGEQRVELFDGASRDGAAIDLRVRDPEHCGEAEVHCEDDEYCVAGACVCRPPLTRIGEECIDTNASSRHCGGPDVACTLCVEGACGSACAPGMSVCDGGCVDTDAHPLHCGECGRPCGANQICIGGACRVFVPAPCVQCPCDTCTSESCCTYPSRSADVICVDGAGCG